VVEWIFQLARPGLIKSAMTAGNEQAKDIFSPIMYCNLTIKGGVSKEVLEPQ